MAEPIAVQVTKSPTESWGFRLQGGFEFQKPLIIQRVNEESPSVRSGLQGGDLILAINGQDCSVMPHKMAQEIIVGSGNSIDLVIQRGGALQTGLWQPEVTPVGEMPLVPTDQGKTFTKTSLTKDQAGPVRLRAHLHHKQWEDFAPFRLQSRNLVPKDRPRPDLELRSVTGREVFPSASNVMEFSRQWNQTLNSNQAGAANNAQDFTKQFMADMFGGPK
eukprot:maker-scaffold445_size168248-snap-gene-0.22 protein:Tk06582 transcript:maker-scaffold445_size168248-snap-gene-0.22-mRNA-1 annotation:"z band alternatively spliced pdz-motif protein isoform p"